MADIEKIKKGLTCCLSDFSLKCDCCVYAKDGSCKEQLKREIMDILDGQLDQPTVILCKDCKWWDDHTEECGNPDGVCFRNGWCRSDFYCGDGEQK